MTKCLQVHHEWVDVTTMESYGRCRELTCTRCGVYRREPLWSCVNCGWQGSQPSWTEDKVVTETDGTIVVERPVYPVCPECFQRVLR